MTSSGGWGHNYYENDYVKEDGAFTWTLPQSNLDTHSLREVGTGDAMSWVGAFGVALSRRL